MTSALSEVVDLISEVRTAPVIDIVYAKVVTAHTLTRQYQH